MEICKNKKSGEYFIYIEPTGKGKAHFVLPQGKVKSLKGRAKDFLSQGLISDTQIKRYKEELNQRTEIDEKVRRAASIRAFESLPLKKRIKLWAQEFNKMPLEKQKIFLEKLTLN